MYTAAAGVNIVCCAADRQPLRRLSKGLLMPLLLGFYLVTASPARGAVAAALALGWLGDLLLIRPDDARRFPAGIACFALGHICYIVAICGAFSLAAPLWLRVALPLAFAVGGTGLYVQMRPSVDRPLRLPCLIYIFILCAVGALAALAFFAGSPGGGALLAGALLFQLSDGILSYQTFNVGDPAPKFDFAVMLTYIAAQTMLILAFCR